MEAIWLLPILACPLIMGVMMFVMMRRTRCGDRPVERPDKDIP